MNEFTKQELEQIRLEFDCTILKIGEDRIADSYLNLRDKIDSMIDKFCEHESDQGGCGGDFKHKCKKCGEYYYA